MHWRTFREHKQSLVVTGLLLIAALAAVIAALPDTGNTHAQNSCDDPPFDTSSISRVWDKTDFCSYEEGVIDEIISGGVGRDGIPPIDNPAFESIEDAQAWLADQSPVIALQVNGVARAYPLAMLTRHEIVNDVIADVPVAVTFCPLCNAALVYDRRVDGQVYRFGVSGLLRNSDLIMWDDVTQSWWQQFTGTGIVGQHTGDQLDIFPSQVVGFGAYGAQYPDGEVLSPGSRDYGRNPYTGYDSNPDPFLFRGELDPRLFPTERVLGYFTADTAIAYPFPVLAEQRVINDTVAGIDVVAFWQPGVASALDRGEIDDSKDVGMAALYRRDLDGQTLTFAADENGVMRDEQTDSAWNVFGTATEGELAGSQLQQLNAAPHFWFAWAAFVPDTILYSVEETE